MAKIPFLTARMGVAFIGHAGPRSGAAQCDRDAEAFRRPQRSGSHRHQANVFVSLHDLEDTYLPAFRAAIVEARRESVMCAYNRINGQPACASDDLLKSICAAPGTSRAMSCPIATR